MYIFPHQKNIFYSFIVTLLFFGWIFIAQENFEFMGYIAVVLGILFLILISNKSIRYPNYILWLLFLWAFLHMLGGVEMGNGNVIYTYVIYHLVGEPYLILKYDQVVHALGFFAATLVVYTILLPYLKPSFSWKAIGIVVVMAGLGLGALNEIIEFGMTVVLPNTNVGGYENTALDLVFNFLGALLAFVFLKKKHRK